MLIFLKYNIYLSICFRYLKLGKSKVRNLKLGIWVRKKDFKTWEEIKQMLSAGIFEKRKFHFILNLDSLEKLYSCLWRKVFI